MKVLMIAPQPFFQPRGTPISVYQRLRGLSALGHEVELLTYHIGEDVLIPGVTIRRIPTVPFVHNVQIGPSWVKVLLDILLFCQAIILLTRNHYDLIHSHEEAGFFTTILAIVFRKTHLYDMHSILSQQMANSKYGQFRPIIHLFEKLEHWVINTCDGVITIGADLDARVVTVNPHARHQMIPNLPLNVTSDVSTQENAIDELRTRLGGDDKLRVVYTGTFEPYQGLELLFESIKLIKQQESQVVFVFVGGKPHQIQYWQELMKVRQLDDCTIFTGTVSPDEALSYLKVADILVSPRTEGLSVPLKIYTYLYSGKPIVATNLFAHTQVLNDDIALLTKPIPDEFARGILTLIHHPERRTLIGEQARQYAEFEFNFENYLKKLDEAYRWYEPSQPPTQVFHESKV